MPIALVALVLALPLGFRGWAALRESTVASKLAPEHGRYVKADDVALYIQEHGPTDGPPVLLVHGAAAWSGTWRDTQAVLAERGFHVISVDLPPFGFSQRPQKRYDRPKQAARLLALLDALEVDQVAMVGHSFGGGPTLELALMAPERVSGLVLVCGAIGLDSAPADPRWVWAADRPFLRELFVASSSQNPFATRPVLERMVHDPAAATDDRVALYQAPFGVTGTTEAVGAWLPEIVHPVRAWSHDPARLQAFDRPVALIWGGEDTVTPPDQAERLHELFPDSELLWIHDVGHIPHIEKPAFFHNALVGFLEAHPAEEER